MKNKLKKGDAVVCVSEDFPHVITTEKDKSNLGIQAPLHPAINEHLVINETLGDFLRFEKYDTDSFNWWHHSRFVDYQEKFIEDTVNGEAFFCYTCSALMEEECVCEEDLGFDEENIYHDLQL